jgi:hypothetical protein
MDALTTLLVLALARLVLPATLLLLAGTWLQRRRVAG